MKSTKDAILSVRVTPKEKKEFERQAKKKNRTLSNYLYYFVIQKKLRRS